MEADAILVIVILAAFTLMSCAIYFKRGRRKRVALVLILVLAVSSFLFLSYFLTPFAVPSVT
jgi:hypothetical protein